MDRRKTKIIGRASVEQIKEPAYRKGLEIEMKRDSNVVSEPSERADKDRRQTVLINPSREQSLEPVDDNIANDPEQFSSITNQLSVRDDFSNMNDLWRGVEHEEEVARKDVVIRADVNIPLSDITICGLQDMDLTEVLSAKDLEVISAPSVIKKHDSEELPVQKDAFVEMKVQEEQQDEEVDVGQDRQTESCTIVGNRAPRGGGETNPVKKSRLPQPKVRGKSGNKEQGKKKRTKDKRDKESVLSVELPKGVSEEACNKNTDPQKGENKSVTSDTDSTTGCQSDSEGEAVMKRFMAYLVKPGKISFTAGRKTMNDIIASNATQKSRSKSRSILPTVQKSRSKSRAKSAAPNIQPDLKSSDSDSVFEFVSPRSRRKDKDSLKYPADISLSESTCEPKPSYSQFCGREMPHPKQTVVLLSENQEEIITDSPHGIMLVLANGRRTKPRSKSKSVRYKKKLVNVVIASPEKAALGISGGDNNSNKPTPDESDDACIKPMSVDAGNTPVRRSCRKRSIREAFCVPESPAMEVAMLKTDDARTVDGEVSPFSLHVDRRSLDCSSLSNDSPIMSRQVTGRRQRQIISSPEEDESDGSPSVTKKRHSILCERAAGKKSRSSSKSTTKKIHRKEAGSILEKQKKSTEEMNKLVSAISQQATASNNLSAESYDFSRIVIKTEPNENCSDPETEVNYSCVVVAVIYVEKYLTTNFG